MYDPIGVDYRSKSLLDLSQLKTDLLVRYVLALESYEFQFIFVGDADILAVWLQLSFFATLFIYYEVLLDHIFKLG